MIAPDVKKLIKDIYPADDISDEAEDLLAYSYDATGAESAPELVAYPRSADQISRTLKLANERKFPVTARGAGTGFVGASIPAHHGVALVMTRMRRILEIDEDNLTALVEPGLVTGTFQAEVEKRGLFYPPDPASLNMSTLGGNVAMGSGGPRGVKYGVTKDYVLGLEVVLPAGEIIQTGARTVKSVVGYDITRLMVGSEGTLGIITKIRVRLLPLPESVKTALAVFRDVKEAAEAVSAIIGHKVIPRTLEFMDRESVLAVENLIHAGLPEKAGALLLIETDGSSLSAEAEMDIIKGILDKMNVMEIRIADNGEEADMLWKVRRSLSQAVMKIRPSKLNEDITVPRSRIPDLVARLSELSIRLGTPIVNFGHAGDGNMHVNVMTDKNDPAEYEKAKRGVGEVFRICLELGGTLSGEHGIGTGKSAYIEREIGKQGVELIKRIKSAFDPNNILNPGKIIPEEGK